MGGGYARASRRAIWVATARRGAARADRAMAMAFGVGQKSAIDRVDEWRMGVAREACEDAGL